MSARSCSVCSVENQRWLGRGMCRRCYARMRYRGALIDFERASRPWSELADDLAVLLARTNDPGVIASTLQMTPKAIAQAAHRNGRNDLARPFWALDRAERKKVS